MLRNYNDFVTAFKSNIISGTILIEVEMKNRFLTLILIGLMTTTAPCFAELTTSDTYDADYLRNHGHSEITIEAVQRSKCRANGEEYKSEVKNPMYEKAPMKQIRYFFMNVDPAYDDESFMQHDIKAAPNWRDY